jgi:CRP-like cAMP-binding protein
VTETVRPVTAIAAEPTTVIRISRSLFRKVLEGFPEAARLMRDRLAERANQATEEISLVRGTLDQPDRRR